MKQRTMKNELSHLEDDLTRLTKRLQVEGGNDEITLGFDEILGRLVDHLPEEETQPNLIQKLGTGIAGFFNRILGRG